MERAAIQALKQGRSPAGARKTASIKLREDRLRTRLKEKREGRLLREHSGAGDIKVEEVMIDEDLGRVPELDTYASLTYVRSSDGERASIMAALDVLLGKSTSTNLTLSEALYILRFPTTHNQAGFLRKGLHREILKLFLERKIPTAVTNDTFSAIYILTNLAAGTPADVAELRSSGLLTVLELVAGNLLEEVRGRVPSYYKTIGQPMPLQQLSSEELVLACNLCEQLSWLIGNLVLDTRETRECVFKGAVPLLVARCSRILVYSMTSDNLTTLMWAFGKLISNTLGILEQPIPRELSDPIDGGITSVLNLLIKTCADVLMNANMVNAKTSLVLSSALQCLSQLYKGANGSSTHPIDERVLICRIVGLIDENTGSPFSEDTSVVASAVKLLGHISLYSSSGASVMCETRLPFIIPKLVTSKHHRITKACLVLVANLSTEKGNTILMTGTPTVLERIVLCLVSTSPRIVGEALWVLKVAMERSFTSYMEEENQMAILYNSNAVSALIGVASSSHQDEQISSALSLLRDLFLYQPHSLDTVNAVDNPNPFIQQAEAVDFRAVLEKLSESQTTEVYITASQLLDELYDECETIE